MKPRTFMIVAFLLVMTFAAGVTLAIADDNGDVSSPDVSSPDDYILLTVVLKHDQSKTLAQIQDKLAASGFWANFPPEGIAVESWYVMMGLGQAVTLRVPPARLREVNRAIEQRAWGAFQTDIYVTYDLSEAAREFRAKAQKAR